MNKTESKTNNLFPIGAGFTKAVFPDAPLNKDILGILCQGAAGTTLKKYHREYKTNNIEVLLTRLDSDILHSQATRQNALQTIRKTIEQQLAEYFVRYRFKSEILDKANWLKEFVDLFRPDDAIVSLDCDCLLEGVLDYCKIWSPKGGYAVLNSNPLLGSEFPQNEKNIRIFKLHGPEHFIEAPDPTKKIADNYFVDINEFIQVRVLTEKLENALPDLTRELREIPA
ncbi:MAG: hypothetical protein JSW59_19040 [Phycisphaerales bacterium]|nr:MAG: hypothetical protein JSW59_19040 [Phycisphaerales bacterium]